MTTTARASEPLFTGAEWTPELIEKAHSAIEKVTVGEFGLDIYPHRIEIISSEQMLDAYTSIGMPTMYRHWSFGKHFIQEEHSYRTGRSGLAYELVINSNPLICYNMADNSMLMHTLVIAHAAFGHNHFFKNNVSFKSEAFREKHPGLWGNSLFQNRLGAEGIIDYLDYAKKYIAACEEKHGYAEVERVLDAAHALRAHSVFHGRKPQHRNEKKERERALKRAQEEERHYDALFETTRPKSAARRDSYEEAKEKIGEDLPQENILYFLAQHAPKLAPWQREILRIVYMIAQYFSPQAQTKIMNEGCATFVHYETLNRMYEKGLLDDGSMLEFLQSHTGVTMQPGFDDPRYAGNFNPYAIGFAMMQEIKRIATGREVDGNRVGKPCSKEQLEEDREWFPDIALRGDYWGLLKDVWEGYRDESFIQQFLSPRLMRTFKIFRLTAEEEDEEYLVRTIHDERGYRDLRSAFSRNLRRRTRQPNISVAKADLMSDDRMLLLRHVVEDGSLLHKGDAERTLRYVEELWGYPAMLEEVEATPHGEIVNVYESLLD